MQKDKRRTSIIVLISFIAINIFFHTQANASLVGVTYSNDLEVVNNTITGSFDIHSQLSTDDTISSATITYNFGVNSYSYESTTPYSLSSSSKDYDNGIIYTTYIYKRSDTTYYAMSTGSATVNTGGLISSGSTTSSGSTYLNRETLDSVQLWPISGYGPNGNFYYTDYYSSYLSSNPFSIVQTLSDTQLDQLASNGTIGYTLSVNGDLFLTSSSLEADINPAAAPIPGAAWLFGSGLVGLIGLKRKYLG
jgi:hypothetical protein